MVIRLCTLSFALTVSLAITVQDITPSAAAVAKKSQLVEVTKLYPSIRLELWYATEHNFTHRVLYPCTRCFVLEEVAHALGKIQHELEQEGLGLKIWDGYRPLSVQKLMWDLVPDERYVDNPKSDYAIHTRGTAVDLTLVTKDGTELDMGTSFDDFSERAHTQYQNLPPHILANRKKLEYVMERHGFKVYVGEWWHFDYQGWQAHEKLDYDLNTLP